MLTSFYLNSQKINILNNLKPSADFKFDFFLQALTFNSSIFGYFKQNNFKFYIIYSKSSCCLDMSVKAKETRGGTRWQNVD